MDPAGPDAPSATNARKVDEPGPVPWHFKLFLAALTLYLGFRAAQLVELIRR